MKTRASRLILTLLVLALTACAPARPPMAAAIDQDQALAKAQIAVAARFPGAALSRPTWIRVQRYRDVIRENYGDITFAAGWYAGPEASQWLWDITFIRADAPDRLGQVLIDYASGEVFKVMDAPRPWPLP